MLAIVLNPGATTAHPAPAAAPLIRMKRSNDNVTHLELGNDRLAVDAEGCVAVSEHNAMLLERSGWQRVGPVNDFAVVRQGGPAQPRQPMMVIGKRTAVMSVAPAVNRQDVADSADNTPQSKPVRERIRRRSSP